MAKIAFNFPPAGAVTVSPGVAVTAAPPVATAAPPIATVEPHVATILPDETSIAGRAANIGAIDVQSTVAQPVSDEVDKAQAEIAALKLKLAAAKKTAKRLPQASTPAPAATEAAPLAPAAQPAPSAAPAARKGPRGARQAPEAPARIETPERIENTAPPTVAQIVSRPSIATAAPGVTLTTQNVHQIHNNQAVATRGASFDDDGGSDIEFSDLVVPRLNIVQKVGDLSQAFEPGTIVLGKTIALDQPARLVIASFMPKKYVEKIEGGATMGRIAKTPQEVVNMGGTIDYNEAKETKRPLFQTLATALVILQRGAEDPEAAFPFIYEGHGYALVFWSMKGTAYTNAAKVFFTARKTGLFKTSRSAMISGYLKQWVLLETEAKKYSTNWAMIPIVNLAEETTEAFRAWVHQMLRPDAGAVDTASGE